MARYILIGKIGSGKSHLAREFARIGPATVLSFGKPVYELAASILGREVDKSRSGDRQILTSIGTSWGRNGEDVGDGLGSLLAAKWKSKHGYPDIWVDHLIGRVRNLPPKTNLVIDDARFENEIRRLVNEQQFIPVLVTCNEQTRQARLRARGESNPSLAEAHPSEQIARRLDTFASQEMILPVIWNDRAFPKPNLDWCFLAQFWLENFSRDLWAEKLSVSKLGEILHVKPD